MKSNQERICELRVFLERLEDFKQFCVAAGDSMRLENVLLSIDEAREEIRTLSIHPKL